MPERNDDSKTRTKWAEDRTILANERTFSSWMGMGLGAVGVAIGLKAVIGANDAEAMPVRNYRLLSTAMTVATLAVGGVLWSL